LNQFVALVTVGLSFGAAYALLALAINIIYSSSNILNFAQGEFMMLGGMLGWLFYSVGGIPYLAALLLVALVTGLIGVLEYYVSVWPLLRRRAALISVIIATLGFSIVMRIATAISMGRVQRFAKPPLGEASFNVFGVSIIPQSALIIGATALALAILWWVYSRTTVGLALRAAAVQPDSAQLVGINVSRAIAASFGVAGATAGLAGLLISPISYASPWLGLDFAIQGFAAAIIGGLGSWRGAVIGGLLLGVSRSLILTYVSPSWGSLFTLVLILLVLYARPNGLFGEWQASSHGAK
jgi:branched-chain amino acid transport system permease protein